MRVIYSNPIYRNTSYTPIVITGHYITMSMHLIYMINAFWCAVISIQHNERISDENRRSRERSRANTKEKKSGKLNFTIFNNNTLICEERVDYSVGHEKYLSNIKKFSWKSTAMTSDAWDDGFSNYFEPRLWFEINSKVQATSSALWSSPWSFFAWLLPLLWSRMRDFNCKVMWLDFRNHSKSCFIQDSYSCFVQTNEVFFCSCSD